MNDERILALFWQRDEAAIRESEKKYGRYCLTIAHNILDSLRDAEECVNDTWLRAWNTIPPARPSRLRLYLAKLTRNLSLDRFRRLRREKRGSGELEQIFDELEECLQLPGSEDGTEATFFAQELEKSIRAFLETLSYRESDIFLRRYFFAESVPAIAKRYALRESYVLVILSRTRKKLRESLIADGYSV